MTAPMMPDSGAQRLARIREDLAKIKAAVDSGQAPPTIVQRYLERERITPEQEMAAMPMDMREWVGNAARAAYQGASFNFGDELMGAVRGAEQSIGNVVSGQPANLRENVATGIADERAQLDRFRTESPKTAFALEMAGGAASGVGVARAAGSIPRLALRNPIRAAAVGGAVAGVGSGEDAVGRAAMGTVGAVAGAGLTAGAQRLVTSGAADKVVRGARAAVDNLSPSNQPAVMSATAPRLTTPRVTPARAAVARVLADETGSMDPARAAVAELEGAGMGRELLVLNAAGEPGARLGRAVANAPSVPFARTSANEVLGDALARQGGALGREVAEDIGTATGLGGRPGPVALRDMQDDLSARMGKTFEAFRSRGDLQPERTAQLAAAPKAPAGGPVLESARTASGRPVRDLTRVSREGLLDELARRSELEKLYQADFRKYGPSSAVTVRNQEVITTLEDLLEKQHGMQWDDIWADVAQRQQAAKGPAMQFDPESGGMIEVDDVVPTPASGGAGAMPSFMEDIGDGPLSLDPRSGVAFQRYLDAVRQNPELGGLPETDARVIDEAFKLLQEEVRRSGRGESAVKTRGLTELRNRVLSAIEGFDPDYAKAVRDYALDEESGKVVQRSFERGLQLRTAPVGTFTAETRGAPTQVTEGMRRGAATAYQSAADEGASNAALGALAKFRDVARGVIGTEGQAKRFKEIFGNEAYDSLLSRLSPKIRAAALNQIVRGNSTTARQLLDVLNLGDDAVLGVLQAASSGPGGLVSATYQAVKAPIAAARASGLGANATEAAKLLSVRGGKRARVVLDALEQVAKEDLKRKRAVVPVTGAASRSAVDRIR